MNSLRNTNGSVDIVVIYVNIYTSQTIHFYPVFTFLLSLYTVAHQEKTCYVMVHWELDEEPEEY